MAHDCYLFSAVYSSPLPFLVRVDVGCNIVHGVFTLDLSAVTLEGILGQLRLICFGWTRLCCLTALRGRFPSFSELQSSISVSLGSCCSDRVL